MAEERMTKQIRVYQDTADLIDEILKTKPPKTTFADVVDEVFKKAFPDAYEAVMKSKKRIRNAIDQDSRKELNVDIEDRDGE